MSLFLKLFETTAQYNTYTADTANFIKPNVSYCQDAMSVHYTPVISIANAVITCDSATYNGQTQIATNIVVTLNGSTLVSGTDYTISNNDGGINAGNYTFTIDGIGNYDGSKNGTFTINKVTPTVVIPVAKVLTYQKGVAQELVTAGSTNYGTMKYSTDGETYSTSVPSKTKAGSYTVYYFVEGDSNVNSTEVATVACSINEKEVTATIELSQDTYTYDGTAKEPTVTVKDGGDVIDPSEYTVTYSNNTNAGTASVTITDNTAGDYNVSGVTTFTIDKANQSAPTATGATVDYGSTATATASGGGGQGSLEWSNGSTRTAVGSQSTSARWSGNSNYNVSPWSNSVTLIVNDPYAGHEYVDLGLPSGTKWAKYNIGATSETEYGNYYQYGKGASQYAATSGQSDYEGMEDPLSSSVDTASQVWGGSWHMPTKAQCEELTANTTFTWTAVNGVNGGKFTASNGNYIFIPASGLWWYGSSRYKGSDGFVWSSSPDGSVRDKIAVDLHFESEQKSVGVGVDSRGFGFSVRPVVG